MQVLKASASPLLHYLSGLLSLCWLIYELQTGGPAREEEERRLREMEGGGERLTVKMERTENRKGREELNNVWRLFLLYYILYDRICDLQVLG